MRRGEIVLIDLPSPDTLDPSHVQAGRRPGVVIQVNAATNTLRTVVVIPLTSRLRARRFPFAVEINPTILNGLAQASVALPHQVFTADDGDVIETIGELDPVDLERVENAIAGLMGLGSRASASEEE